MKKKFWMLGVAVAALTSCTQSEVLEVPENRIIGFDSFVGKNTRGADPTLSTQTLNSAWLYGEVGTLSNETFTPDDYNSSEDGHQSLFADYQLTGGGSYNTTDRYWEASKTYRFGAYSDGNNHLNSEVTFNSTASPWYLQIANYAAGERDLIAATATATTNENLSGLTTVGLSFKHLLAKVQFVFTVNIASGLRLKIYPITLTAAKTGTCQIKSNGSVEWSNTASGDYVFDEISESVSANANNTEIILGASGTYKLESYVIPQSNQDLVIGEIKVETLDAQNRVISVTQFKNVKLHIAAHPTWERSTIYSYQGTIGTDAHPIVFHPTVGESWNDPDGANLNIDSYKVVSQSSNE